jgi:hypothetical protein
VENEDCLIADQAAAGSSPPFGTITFLESVRQALTHPGSIRGELVMRMGLKRGLVAIGGKD